jgi:uncharacterized membrane protein
MKKLVISGTAIAVVFSILIVSCSKGDGESNNPPPPPPVSCSGTPGTLFTAVKNLVQANCQSCHNNSIANGGMNWTVDCNIVTNKDRIKVRAVDQGTMPPTGALPQSEKDKITAWVTAGGRITD